MIIWLRKRISDNSVGKPAQGFAHKGIGACRCGNLRARCFKALFWQMVVTERHANGECRAFPENTFDRNVTFVKRDQFPNQRKANAVPS